MTPNAFEATINTLTMAEQTTADELNLAADVADRASRCAAIANELATQIAARESPPQTSHHDLNGSGGLT